MPEQHNMEDITAAAKAEADARAAEFAAVYEAPIPVAHNAADIEAPWQASAAGGEHDPQPQGGMRQQGLQG